MNPPTLEDLAVQSARSLLLLIPGLRQVAGARRKGCTQHSALNAMLRFRFISMIAA